ncbi:MAG TPA: DUF2298 domain-containing protein [Chloroflexia bacterium]|nr:DUF2298 domain-containing protein [Chloroflexia bacterium]
MSSRVRVVRVPVRPQRPARPAAAREPVERRAWPGVLRGLLAHRLAVPVALVAVLIMGGGLRLVGMNWDEGQLLNPDERFMTMVEASLRWPSSIGEYFDEAASPLNPRNVGFEFFAYGTLPTTLLKGIAVALGQPPNATVNLMGRGLSALMDLGTIIFLFLIARSLYRDKRVALLAALFYSLSALAIQYSHFFVVETFTAFFITGAIYWLVRVQKHGGVWNYVLAGVFFGLALASKLSIFTFALIFALVVGYRLYLVFRDRGPHAVSGLRITRGRAITTEQTVVRLLLAVAAAVLVFRIAQPDAFAGSSVLSFAPSERWLQDLDETRRNVGGDMDTPPNHQWANRTALLFPWSNMVLWGMGLPLGLAAWAGWGVAGWRLVRRREWVHLIPVAWVAVLFLHQGTQWVKSMRYFLPIYPMLALLAAWLLVWAWDRARAGAAARTLTLPPRAARLFRLSSAEPRNDFALRLTPRGAGILLGVVVLGTMLWAAAFAGVYLRQNTRIEASRWIYNNVEPGTAIANEHWDDSLPVRLDGRDPYPKIYQGVQLEWFNTDSPEKLQQVLDRFDQADYLVVSSNRVYDSVARIPVRFPMTIRYYDLLFGGRLGFERAAEFTSYPAPLGIPISDQRAEEAFTVYDHPRVQIFRKTEQYDRESAERMLSEGIVWEDVVALNAKQATSAPNALLLTPAQREQYTQSGTWSELFDPASLSNAMPVVTWALLLLLLGVLAAPYLFLVGRHLPDRGYALSKTLGLLLVGWLVWLASSARLVEFSAWGIWLTLLVVGAGAVVIYRRQRVEIREFAAGHWRLLLTIESIFWVAFALFLFIRWSNPDLWHPGLGGEKPMDFAYLNAVVKSPQFPPYDPWFAGGYINYYYFGFALVGMLVKLTGIVPQVAYNLAIPTLFAMTATGAFGVALALVHRAGKTVGRREVRFGLLGALFVAVVGNLGELKLVLESVSKLSTAPPAQRLPGVDYVVHLLTGLDALLAGKPLDVRTDWWYWNATRAITPAQGEAGPINEFPWFTYLFGDLHAHAMALPLTLLALGLTFALLRAPIERTWRDGWEWLRLGLLALAVGALWPTNTWDFPTYTLLVLAAFLLREWHAAGRPTLAGVWRAGVRWLVVVALAYLLFLPFHRSFGGAYDGFGLWGGSRTSVGDYIIAHGFFLFVIGAALLVDFLYGQGHNPLVRAMRLSGRVLFRPRRLRRMDRLYRAVVRPTLAYQVGMGVARAAVVLAVVLVALGMFLPGVLVGLLTLTVLLGWRSRIDPRWQMALVFVGVGLALSLFVEFVVLKGDISRMNTVFKFYLQVWVLFGLAGAAAASLVWERIGGVPRGWRRAWRWGFVGLFAAVLLYPLIATPVRVGDRFANSPGQTLDGTAYMNTAAIANGEAQIELAWDKDAIEWMERNVEGSPVIAEINTYPILYGWGNRYANYTGLPSIVGWDWHQRQQRGVVSGDMVTRRIEAVKELYDTTSAREAHDILRRYGAAYVVVGPLERANAEPAGIAKFASAPRGLWELAYSNEQVQIYRVLDGGTSAGGSR